MKFIHIQVRLPDDRLLFGVRCTTSRAPAMLTSSPWAGTGMTCSEVGTCPPRAVIPSLLLSRTVSEASLLHATHSGRNASSFVLTNPSFCPWLPAVFRILVSQILDRTEPVLYSTMSSEIITVFQYYNYFASHSVNDLGSYLLQLAKEGRVCKIQRLTGNKYIDILLCSAQNSSGLKVILEKREERGQGSVDCNSWQARFSSFRVERQFEQTCLVFPFIWAHWRACYQKPGRKKALQPTPKTH